MVYETKKFDTGIKTTGMISTMQGEHTIKFKISYDGPKHYVACLIGGQGVRQYINQKAGTTKEKVEKRIVECQPHILKKIAKQKLSSIEMSRKCLECIIPSRLQ